MAEDIPLGLEAVALLGDFPSDASRIHVTRGEQRAEALAAFLTAIAPDRHVVLFPPWDCLPYDSTSPSPEAMGRRMLALDRLRGASPGTLVITVTEAILQRVPPPDSLRRLEITTGDALAPDTLRAFCEANGYFEDDRVDEPGEVALRGEVIDIFTAGAAVPHRIAMSGTRIAAIRAYDAATQRTLSEVQHLTILPVAEPSGQVPLGDWLPHARTSFSAPAMREAGRLWRRIQALHRDQPDAPAPDSLYHQAEGKVLDMVRGEVAPFFAAQVNPRRALRAFLRGDGAERRLIAVAPNAGALKKLLSRLGGGREVAGWQEALEGQGTAGLVAPLDHGFVTPDLAVMTAPDVLGWQAAGQTLTRRVTHWQIDAAEMRAGDVVVHEEHGLGRLEGIERVADEDLIALRFAEDQRVLVPVEEAGRIWRYGSAEVEVAFDRPGSPAWTRRRQRTEEAVAEAVQALVAMAGENATRKARPLSPPPQDYERFAAGFAFAETPDQARAIREVLQDLAGDTPMNRLVVGDVGFGKTEVALRAVAAAALSGRQAAVVAPTTVLSRQHYDTFRRRFEGTGIDVVHLSRLVTGRDAEAARARIADGTAKVVIGTHALLGKKVTFADLALLVVDEEQRFGAAHKAGLRALGEGAHMLSMTATPIPRTLQAALVGLHEVSEIATPPARRRPIRTLITEDEDATIRQALLREKRRGGQSFVIVPRVEDIEDVAQRLRSFAGSLDLRIAHGQMPAREIDETMVGFAEGQGDVLLATSIIESGLDVPRANTMIVLHPHLFGLSQLHQLRGRVGRGHRQAWCYLLNAAGQELSEAARRRLGTLVALDRLGAGMAISAQDLDQRGAGDLLGEKQAGHVKRIGLGLYQKLFAEALRAAKGEPPEPRHVAVQIDLAGTLPPDYIPEAEVRINLYHRLAQAHTPAEADLLAEEVADRFGPPPPPVQALLRLCLVRALARAAGITRISAGPEAVALDFTPGAAETFGDDRLERQEDRLLLRQETASAEERLALVLALLEGA